MGETILERLSVEFECAIESIFGDKVKEIYTKDSVSEYDIKAIANKVLFYLDKDQVITIKKEEK